MSLIADLINLFTNENDPADPTAAATNWANALVSKADDSAVVHIAGTETILGQKVFAAGLTLLDGQVIEGSGNILDPAATNAHVEGDSHTVSGGVANVHVEGESHNVNSFAINAHIEGVSNTCGNIGCHLEGADNSITSGGLVHIEGVLNTVDGSGVSHVSGARNSLTGGGDGNSLEGVDNSIDGASLCHVEGQLCQVLPGGDGSHLEGGYPGLPNVTSQIVAHLEGAGNTNAGQGSHLEGVQNVIALGGDLSHVEGIVNTLDGGATGAHCEGTSNEIGSALVHCEGATNFIDDTSYATHCEGVNHLIYGSAYSHFEGNQNTSNGSETVHIEGVQNVVGVGCTGAHCEGGGNSIGDGASGAHCEGSGCQANAQVSHVRGISCVTKDGAGGSSASGWQSIAERASQDAFASGSFTGVQGEAQHSKIVLRGQTPGVFANETTELTFALFGAAIDFDPTKTYLFCLEAIASASDGNYSSFRQSFALYAAAPAFIAGPLEQVNALGAATWNIYPTIAGGYFHFSFNVGPGHTAKTNIAATVRFTEVVNP